MNQTNIIFFILGIFLTYLLIEIKNNCWISNSAEQLQNQNIQILLRQSARWAVASEQDKNPMIAVLHANYGAGYLWALNEIATSKEIESATGIDFLQFKQKVTAVQDMANRKMIESCPGFGPPPSVLTNLS